MMKMKSLGLLGIVSLVLMACSESSYTPVQTTANGQIPQNGVMNPYNPNQTGLNNGMPYNQNSPFMNPNNINPYLNANPVPLNPQAQAQFQIQANAMFNCQARMTPYFYFYKSSSNCALRRQVTYTPSQCACIKAPCDCAEIVEELRTRRARNRYVPSTTIETTTVTTNSTTPNCDPAPTNHSTAPNTAPAPDANGPVPVTGVAGLSTENPAQADAAAETEGVLVSILNEDARALYTRLAKTAQVVEAASKKKADLSTIRTGTNYKCIMTGKGKEDKDYACDLDISVASGEANGLVKVQFPESPMGIRALKSDAIFNGKTVTVGGQGLNTFEAVIKIREKKAELLYNKMSGDAKLGTVDLDQQMQAKIKTSAHLKCYQTINTSPLATECVVKVNTDTGAVQPAL